MPSEGMAVEEEGLTIIAEVTRGAKPSQQDIDELISFIRTTVGICHAQCIGNNHSVDPGPKMTSVLWG